MKIACPHCGFSREVPDGQVPDRPVKVTCPKCQQGFNFDKAAAPAMTTCPACGLEQPAGDTCSGCGVDYVRWAARQEARAEAGTGTPPPRPDAGFPDPGVHFAAASPADLPKAGFWIRFAAYLIDTLILSAVQFGISFALGFAGSSLSSYDGEESIALGMVTWLCGMVIGVVYAVFFTGYNGQTPGKMALRIQVVRSDGAPMSYGRAFLREIVGKFVSALILGIGYLMAAFDRQKQALHDRIAGTYVIRL